MDHPTYREAIKRLGLSQGQAATLFGVDARTGRRWALGEKPVPRAVALCLLLMVSYDVSPVEAMALVQADTTGG
jgi:transcriptional regulator with XRE-family HTH domain